MNIPESRIGLHFAMMMVGMAWEHLTESDIAEAFGRYDEVQRTLWLKLSTEEREFYNQVYRAATGGLDVHKLAQEIRDLWSDDAGVDVRLDGPTRGGFYFIDVVRKGQRVAIEVRDGSQLGLSIIDADTGYGAGADCTFGHVPTLLKYLKRLLP